MAQARSADGSTPDAPPSEEALATHPGGVDRRQGLDQVGQRLRHAREARSLSLRAIARRIGVSPSFVSQVETGKASPSVGTLYSLVNELGLSLDEVMSGVSEREPAEPDIRVSASRPNSDAASSREMPRLEVPWEHPAAARWPRIEVLLQRATDRPTIRLSGVTWERLTHEDDPFVDFLYVTYAPGSSSCTDDNLMRHGGREYGHVISGRLHVQVGFESYDLGPGDSLHFDSTMPHRLANPYQEPCRAVWVVVARKDDTRVTTPPDPDSNHLPGLI